MPALIVFAAGVAVAAALAALGPHAGAALVVGLVAGALIRPFVIGLLANW